MNQQTGVNAVFGLCLKPINLEELMQLSYENISRISEQAIRAFLAENSKKRNNT